MGEGDHLEGGQQERAELGSTGGTGGTTPPSGAMDTGQILLEFRRAGGRTHRDEQLVVSRDGQAVLRGPGGTRQLQLGPGTIEQLQRELDTARFAELPEDLRRPPTEDEPQPDVVEYALTADGHTVRALGSALPAQLLPLVEALNVVMQRNDAR